MELFWRRKITGPSVLFFINRYLVLVYNITRALNLLQFTLLVSCISCFINNADSDSIGVHNFVCMVYLSLIHSPTSCAWWAKATRVAEILCYVPWGSKPAYCLRVPETYRGPLPAFSALRVFALTNRNWSIALIVFVLSIVPCGINFVSPIRKPESTPRHLQKTITGRFPLGDDSD